jgi:hypothetical protein
VGVQEARWDRHGTKRTGENMFSYGKRNDNHEIGYRFFVHKRIISVIKRAEFASDKTSYII